MHREPDAGVDPGSPGLRPGPKAGAKPLRHPGIPLTWFLCAQPSVLGEATAVKQLFKSLRSGGAEDRPVNNPRTKTRLTKAG